MKKILAVLLAGMLLGGCATPKYNYRPIRVEAVEISEPPLSSIATVQVGDTMLRQGKYSEQDALYLKQDTSVRIGSGYNFTRGYYVKTGEDENSEFYLPARGADSGQVIRQPVADPFQVIRLDKKTGEIYAVSVYNLELCINEADYEKKKYSVASPDSFQQTLIYSGKIGSKIKIGYREFSNNLARPAFNNDVEYDISESKIIGYKGARIEVIEATNEYIKYKVIQNFNKAEY